MHSLIDKIHSNLIEYSMISKGDRVLVGLSGGADSVMLLTALFKLKNTVGYSLSAAHINHGIRGESADRDCKFCAELCKKFDIPFHSVFYDIPHISAELKTSEENAGRIKRYEYFSELCSKYGYNKICVAHNMNDSVETVIINMIRGSSLNGLCGIKPVNSNIIRPIFNISRKEIESYLSDNNISYCTDETNLSDDYTRNKIRNNILKIMKEINPSVIKTIFTNTKNFQEDDQFILTHANNLNCIIQNDKNVVVDKTVFDAQHVAIKKRLILDAFQRIKGNLSNIESKHINILLSNLSSGSTYNMPDGINVSVSFDKIIFSREKTNKQYIECKAELNKEIQFEDSIILLTVSENSNINDTDALYVDLNKIKGDLIIRSRKNGDKFVPFGMSGSKKIKQLFTELKIPFIKRDRIPLLCDENGIVAVIPYRIGNFYKIDENTTRILKIQLLKES